MNDLNILKYWIDVEANTPPEILVDQYHMKEKNVYNQILTRYTEKMNWDIKPEMKHQVYIGIVPISNILNKMKSSLDTNSSVQDDVVVHYSSCIASFEVDSNGVPILDTFKIPQYIISIAQDYYGDAFEMWRDNDLFKHAKEKFAEWSYEIKRDFRGITSNDISILLNSLKKLMNILEWDIETSNIAYVESVNTDFRFPSDYMDSFTLKDLIMVKDHLSKNTRKNRSAVESYLKTDFSKNNDIDVADSSDNIKKILKVDNHNFSAWPDANAYPLVTAQQVALNILFNYYVKENARGVFSVNGPPGTGKTTLIQSMIANIIFLRACEVYKLNLANESLFNTVAKIRIDGKELDVHEPVKSLQGFEMIITSSNNDAVKNITEELPLSAGINDISINGFDYFKDVSDELLGSDTWGLIATAMGNSKNNKNIINAFSTQSNSLKNKIGDLELGNNGEEFTGHIKSLKMLFEKYKSNDFTEQELEVFGDAIPGEDLWTGDLDTLHLASPWNNKVVNIKKGSLFKESLKMHKNLIASNKVVFLNNLKIMTLVLQGKIKDVKIINAAWKTYFLLCPVVSTTFSSLSKLFNKVEEGTFGYMFVDEAGQAKPQDLVGGLWRSQISCIIGDPLQVTPVNNITEDVNNHFKEKNGVEDNWDVLTNSAQVIADRVNGFGAMIKNGYESMWVGSPLRVHRRCASPMFDISNKIAYGGKMIHAKVGGGNCELTSILGRSSWFDVKSSKENFDGSWVKSQYEFLKLKLAHVMDEKRDRELPSLYVITPYRDVALKTIQMLKKDVKEWIPSDYSISHDKLSKWLFKSIGTIHTFQGKEADIVFVLLGGNPKKDVSWAVSSPNIINVASTRAKNSQYIIGDKKLWNKGVLKDTIKIMDDFAKG